MNHVQCIARKLGIILFAAAVSACHTLPQAEYSEFNPLPAHQRVMNQINITWVVREDVADFCAKAKGMGKEQAYMTPPVACAVWQTSRKECTIITGTTTSHVALGHEVRHCFEGHFH